ncbi:hypothetical protein A2803_01640 [Candidatus Woesebacteria bacterium RIFCSPHIGHO2_01_FULL_44_21]|uniref:PAS domain-containing protein n=1 Tax=Candidatus Woesebacteria bacterium RIFCSPHIGHO2_01_FULL_44_21 TaxID=1802503 RepID=A0A1F7YWT1_9BACT|nr:MAG: hypothetical protein A2803_01640 [Candidatus Woesebacteria bacterium RIFCSPHIGHO2_01_FULL_44_21]OGM69575.1 MAG: hypothetical protein A2897_03155 [Candidatus Woesebacteria bacterium RIFCSPLOWO2_01_FULL_44_24b]
MAQGGKIKKNWKAKIGEQKDVAKDTKEITFEIHEPGFAFKAGQYVWIIVPELHYEDPRGNRRAFSICSSPSEDGRISVVFRNYPSGFKKTLTELPAGSEVSVVGPFGYLDFPDNPEASVVFIAGGVGVAPFMSMVRSAAANKDARKITLLYANSTETKAVYADELSKIASENKNIIIKEKKGTVDWDWISESVSAPASVIWYVIGPKDMVSEVARLLYDNGVEEKSIRFEEFYVSRDSLNVSLEKIWDTAEVFKLAVESSFNHIILTDINANIVFANKGAEIITGFTNKEMVGQTPRLWGGLMAKAFYEKMWQTIKNEKRPFEAEIKNRRKSGEIYQTITRISPIFDKTNGLIGFMGTEEDISRRLMLEEDLKNKIAELEKINKFMIGREVEMRDLKERIAKLQLEIKKQKGGG